MRLLDYFSNMNQDQANSMMTAASQILQGAGNPTRPFGLGQAAGVGMESYKAQMDAQKKKKQDDELRALQMMQARMGNERGGMELQQMRESLARQGNIRDQLGALNVGQQSRPPAAQAIPSVGAQAMPSVMASGYGADPSVPDWAKPQQSPGGGLPSMPAPQKMAAPTQAAPKQNATKAYVNRLMQEAEIYSQNGDFESARKLYGEIAKFDKTDEFDQTPRVGNDANGNAVLYVMDKQGNPKILDGLKPREKMELLDTNSGFEAYNPNALVSGQKFKKGMSTDAAANRAQAAEFHKSGKIPPGYRMSQDGTRLEAIPGGPADIGKALPSPAVKELGGAGTAVENTKRLATSFKSEYGGKTILGDMSNKFGRVFGDETGQAQWWQDMDSLQNQTRHELFGSALTATELAAWEKTSITPHMEEKQIQENLVRRQEIEARAASKLARSYMAAGYNKNQITELLGTAAQYLQAPAPLVPPTGGASQPKQRKTIGGKTYEYDGTGWSLVK